MAPAPLPTFEDFPATIEELTPAWLTKAFHANGIECDIESLEYKRVGTGQVGISYRLTPNYRTQGKAPKTLIAKLVATDPDSRKAGISSRTYVKEANVYRVLAPALRGKGMRIANCWAAEWNPEREATLLLLEDVSPAVPGDQNAGASVEAIEVAVKEAAIMHATFWESPALAENASWLQHPDPAGFVAGLKAVLPMIWGGFQERYKDKMTPAMKEIGDKLWDMFESFIGCGPGDAHATLFHADLRIDNILFAPPGGLGNPEYCYTVDWQTIAINRGGLDVGYLVGSGLSTEQRQKHEKRLVKLWHDELVKQGIKSFTLEEAWDDYRRGQFHGILMAVFSAMSVGRTERGDKMFWVMFQGHAQAAIELKADELLAKPSS